MEQVKVFFGEGTTQSKIYLLLFSNKEAQCAVSCGNQSEISLQQFILVNAQI